MRKSLIGCLAALALLVLPRAVRAQFSYGLEGNKGNAGVNLQFGQKQATYKGWYLYWPMEALKQPRMPMPYPWWPQQTAAAPAPAPVPPLPPPGPAFQPGNNPPSPTPIHLPNDTQSLPALPGVSSWGDPYSPAPVAPVGYSLPAPSYWYGR